MEGFCSEIVEEIKAAKNEAELIKVIGNSLSGLRHKQNSFNESGYIMNMIASLRASHPTGDHSTDIIDNIELAIAIFKQFQIERKERIF
jgi:hypothetical protein